MYMTLKWIYFILVMGMPSFCTEFQSSVGLSSLNSCVVTMKSSIDHDDHFHAVLNVFSSGENLGTAADFGIMTS